jgi:Methyltransferase domain
MDLYAAARQVRDRSKSTYRRWMLRRTLGALVRTLREGRPASQRLLDRLRYGWANESWSAETCFLASMLNWLPTTAGTIVECGSGLSTLVLAAATTSYGRRLLTLEHDMAWAQKVRAALTFAPGSNVEVTLTPLQSYGDFDWYSIAGVPPLAPIGFVVCDGPPGATRGGRYGLVPVLKDMMAPGCIVLLDDTQRPEERRIFDRWREELDATVIEEAPTHSVLRVGSPASQSRSQPAARDGAAAAGLATSTPSVPTNGA